MKGRMDENDEKTSRDDCNHKPVYRFYLICNMFRPLTASLFLMAFVIQMFSGQLIVLDYYANTTAFAKNCINKARPKMHCNGKCQMMKKLQQQENKDQQTPGHRSENKAQVLSSRSSFCSIQVPIVIEQKIFFYIIAGDPVDRTLAVFHPPRS